MGDTLNQRPTSRPLGRRAVLKVLAGLGVGTVAFQRALAAQVEAAGAVTPEMIAQAEWIAGIELDAEERVSAATGLGLTQGFFRDLREVEMPYHTPPAIRFQTAAPQTPSDAPNRTVELTEDAAPRLPANDEDLAFLPVTELSALLRERLVSSTDLTKLYLDRLKRFDPLLKCVVSLTEELALEQAARADREIAAGRYRGPLHGVPWGAKDLIAYPGYKTTWGAACYQEQTLPEKATVAQRLEEAGAVLVAKLAMGALARGDRWFGGFTRNPWNPSQGSSGSSAGSASATAAGLVGFSLGSETMGSIIDPCRRCGATGLRPTFGRVSRYGCMPLAWSMDKVGPITRSVEDAALVFAAIHGDDGRDLTAVDRPFDWPSRRPLHTLTVGYLETNTPPEDREELQRLAQLGVGLRPIRLPDQYPLLAMTLIRSAESAAVFDGPIRAGETEGLGDHPSEFQEGQFIPAVEYLRANRVRSLLMQEMEKVMADVDLYVDAYDNVLTSLTGHPGVVIPHGFHQLGSGLELPQAITFTGRLFGETTLLSVAHAYQQATDSHLRRPPLNADPAAPEDGEG